MTETQTASSDLTKRVQQEAAKIVQGGPQKYRDRLVGQGKLFVRDRLKLYFPGGPEYEDGLFANNMAEGQLPADGMITGAGRMEQRTVLFMANDYTVKAGSMAERGVEKFLRVQERALKTKRPILYLVDSSGARITDQAGFFAQRDGIGRYFYNHSMLSGRVPQISVLYGPCVAGSAYTPVFCDFSIMVRDMSAMCIASPRMVAMVTGEETDLETLGGPDLHMEQSGSCHLIAQNEEDAAHLVWRLVGYLPDNYEQQPPRYEARAPSVQGTALDSLVPEDPNQPFDMHDLIDGIVDADSLLELSGGYAPELLTAFGRIDGRVVGIVANNSLHRAGAIFPESADKAAEFILKCDAFNIPLVYLCDTPGFMVGRDVERQGVLRRGKKFIYATSVATVPKFCVVVRKAYGAGIYAMCGPAFDPDATLALPTGEIAVMGAEAAVNAVFRNHIDAIADEAERARFIEEKRREYRRDVDIHVSANDMIVDHVVAASDLRTELVRRLAAAEGKHVELPGKRHGTII